MFSERRIIIKRTTARHKAGKNKHRSILLT